MRRRGFIKMTLAAESFADQDREFGGSTVDEGNLAAPQKPNTLGFPAFSDPKWC